MHALQTDHVRSFRKGVRKWMHGVRAERKLGLEPLTLSDWVAVRRRFKATDFAIREHRKRL